MQENSFEDELLMMEDIEDAYMDQVNIALLAAIVLSFKWFS